MRRWTANERKELVVALIGGAIGGFLGDLIVDDIGGGGLVFGAIFGFAIGAGCAISILESEKPDYSEVPSLVIIVAVLLLVAFCARWSN